MLQVLGYLKEKPLVLSVYVFQVLGMTEVVAVDVEVGLTDGVASQAFWVQTIVRSGVQEQELQPSAAGNDWPTR